MSYTKTNWLARVGTALNRFLKANETTGSVELTADPTGISTNGTPISTTNLNHIEDGIYDAHYPTFTENATLENIASGEVQETLWGKVKKAISRVITHDGWLNQGVKSTDSPAFITLGFSSLNPDNSTETSVQLSPGESQVLPKGAYAISSESGLLSSQMKYGSDWFIIPGAFVISDGVNFRLSNRIDASETYTARIRKW